MSVTCTRATSDESTTRVVSPGRTTSDKATREAIILGDPTGIGYAVVLPPVTRDTQGAMNAIAAQTPFVAYRRPADKPTTYDSVETFLREHPEGETLRPILNRHFNYTG
ncbi:hypothetical protein G9463_19195 [Haloarcula sp. JP-Z28]|uniref:hypothetical protein n=1 Tax=Haloarcula sp. JP-Z28 TaxID=2716715 RepID=UPI001404DF4F|nr:hypothetical protein [Haloarcula sp. JP-Z28]NHN65410.1 hypothetical protein [Haloarcula sp. JP-Z28]